MPSPFDLPEVAAVIFEYLYQLSLVSCIRVCKSWNTHCLPLLWRSIHLTLDRPSKIIDIAAQDYDGSLGECTQTGKQDSRDETTINIATKLQWVHDLHISVSALDTGPSKVEAMDHILKLCSNLRFLEIDHEGDFEFSSELVNSKLAQLQFSHRVGVRLLRSALNHFRHLKSLTLVETQQDTIPVLIDALPSLPHLRDLGFLIDHIHVTDEPYAQLLAAGGSNRWRRIVLPRLGPETIDALANHADTLEYLDIDAADIRWNESLVDLLASFAQLQILRLTSYDIDASIFIDYIDDATDEYEEEEEQQQWWQQCRQLRPWKCENTLIEFKAHINGIPRNGIPLNHLNEEYPGESHDLQEQVLARLGRFHNLQCLELGLETISKEHRRVVKEYPEPQPLPYYDPDYQYECVDMTLENGLEMLHQLRQLRHLNVGHMATRIGPQEAEWMIEHWPRLRTIEGLCPSEEYMAISKFVELAPHIEVIEFLPMYDSD